MKTDLIHTLTVTFEAHAQQTDGGVEFWLARDVQHLLGYTRWENFINVVSRAKTACEISGHAVADHFPDVRKMVNIGSGAKRQVADIRLSRYASYLIVQNGNPSKAVIAIGQTYFALQTRRQELSNSSSFTRLSESDKRLACARRMPLRSTSRSSGASAF